MAMAWYEEIAYAEPTILGTLGAGFLHMLLWLAVTSWEFGLAKRVDAFLARKFPRLYFETIHANYAKKEDIEMWGVEDGPERCWVTYFCTLLHHGTAGLLMYVGFITQSAWLWRHGLLTQLFGSDLLDFMRIAWCLLLPPGPYPTRNGIKHTKYLCFIFLHHSTSLLAGLPTSIYFADHPEFQFMGILLAGYPMLIISVDLFVKCVDPRFQTFHAVAEATTASAFGYQRIVKYFPVAVSLLWTVWDSNIPVIAKLSLALGGLVMSLFNLMIVTMISKNMMKLMRGAKHEKGVEELATQSLANCHGESEETINADRTAQIIEQDRHPTLLSSTLLRQRRQHSDDAATKSA